MSETKAEKVKVKLTDESHTHQGKPCARDDVIEVRKDQAKRLIDARKAAAA